MQRTLSVEDVGPEPLGGPSQAKSSRADMQRLADSFHRQPRGARSSGTFERRYEVSDFIGSAPRPSGQSGRCSSYFSFLSWLSSVFRTPTICRPLGRSRAPAPIKGSKQPGDCELAELTDVHNDWLSSLSPKKNGRILGPCRRTPSSAQLYVAVLTSMFLARLMTPRPALEGVRRHLRAILQGPLGDRGAVPHCAGQVVLRRRVLDASGLERYAVRPRCVLGDHRGRPESRARLRAHPRG